MRKLGVNIDHIATLRQARAGIFPDPVFAAGICEESGCDSIVAHLREDRRHINDNDVRRLVSRVKTRFNLEMSIADEIVDIACRLRPEQATLVPEKRKELTTEGGLDVIRGKRRLESAAGRLSSKGIEVSVFIDPDKEQISAAAKMGVKIIELNTGSYAQAKSPKTRSRRLLQIIRAAELAEGIGLTVNAGHGLDYENVSDICAIRQIEEVNIGYSIICNSLFWGLKKAVKTMRDLIHSAAFKPRPAPYGAGRGKITPLSVSILSEARSLDRGAEGLIK